PGSSVLNARRAFAARWGRATPRRTSRQLAVYLQGVYFSQPEAIQIPRNSSAWRSEMAEQKLVGQNYSTPDLRAKVTGRARYSEDSRGPGMLFAGLLLGPYPHARVKSIDPRAALAMPGVKAILTADDVPGPKDQVNDAGQVVKANPKSEKALTNEP